MRSPVEVVAPARLGTPFRWLLGSSWVSNLGDGFAIAAGPLLVASQTHDPFLVALAALAQWLPPFVFGLWAGVLSDRMDRKTLIVTVDLLRAAVVLVIVGYDRHRHRVDRGRARRPVPARHGRGVRRQHRRGPCSR